jgi:hypothetical protein
VHEVVKEATKPLMHKQGKLYGALLSDWAEIVGPARAKVTRPERLQFANSESLAATLHIQARPHAAPELVYAQTQILEQCARYFGYRAIERVIIHASHEGFPEDETPVAHPPPEESSVPSTALPDNIPGDMRAVLERLSRHLASPSDKK